MPRKKRMYMPGYPFHVIQRGNNRQPCFFTLSDREHYLNYLVDACERYGVSCHAYVLMTNHTHLILTPSRESSISLAMQSLGRRYVQYVNKRHKRWGTLWESRHKASVICANAYLLACYRYVELNPVRANMVCSPLDYPWSSYAANAFGQSDPLVSPHEVYKQLSATALGRQAAYQALFDENLTTETINRIRVASNTSLPLGDKAFRNIIQNKLGRDVGYAHRGRPRSKNG